MADEDWDAEIDSGVTSLPTKAMNSLKLEDNTYNSWNSWGRGSRGSENHSGFTRGRGRGFGRGFGRGSSSDNWRNENQQVNGYHKNNYDDSGDNKRSSFGNSRNDFSNGFGGDRTADGNNTGGFGRRSRGRGGFHSSRDSNSDGRFNNAASEPLRIEVINDSIGKVIGKGGSKIRDLQAQSGARIKVLSDESSMASTPIDIFGTEDQKAKAKQMIEDLTIPAGDFRAWAEREDRKYEEQQASVPKINWGALKQAAAQYEKEKWADCPDIIKNFYKESKKIALMDPLDVAEIRLKKNNITVQDLAEHKRKIPNPVLTFEDAYQDYPEILDTIYHNKFKEPSPIQSQAWPVILSGMDCIGIAQTGTGKTLAFLLPAFIHIDRQTVPREKRGGPSCLVLSPTRELAQQIEMEVKKYHYKGIKSVCIYGGGDRREQIKAVQQGVEIIIGTPGRLNDLLMNEFFSVKSVTYLILDEADRMLDMGFEPEIKKILLDIRPDRQTIMTSATWLPGVQRIADQYLKDPVRVNVGSMDLQACHSVTQLVEFINPEDKQERTLEFINSMGPEDKLIIFVGRKITADDISSNFVLREVDVGIQCIHGDREQADREQALEDLKTGKARVLIATDVASRGLDVKDLTHVLNYDFPRHIEDYVHRIGRTGRAGRSGCALTFITREDWMHAGKLIPIMEEAGQEIPDELQEMAERWKQHRERQSEMRFGGGGRGGGGRGGGSGCYKCGKEGHISRSCPEGGMGGGRGGGGGFRGGGGGRGKDKRERGGIRISSYDAV